MAELKEDQQTNLAMEEFKWFVALYSAARLVGIEPKPPTITIPDPDIAQLQLKVGYILPHLIFNRTPLTAPSTADGRNTIFEMIGMNAPVWTLYRAAFDEFPLELSADNFGFTPGGGSFRYDLVLPGDLSGSKAAATPQPFFLQKYSIPQWFILGGLMEREEALQAFVACPKLFDPAIATNPRPRS